MTYPKIELHVHLEGTVRPRRLLETAARNGYALPADTAEGLEALYDFRDFAHFVEIFELTAGALQTYDDFRSIVVDYAAEAASHGAVYIEAIFAPGLWRGLDTNEVFSGCRDGAQEARELHGVEVRLTPDLPGVYSPEEAEKVVRFALRYRERGVVGLGLVGLGENRDEPFARAFALARDGGLGSVPHAGEIAGPESVRDALGILKADRVRHGIRATEDAGLVRELADRAIVLDVCPISNLRTRAVRSLHEHPLPQLVAAGVHCSISSDDPAMFGTDLTRDCEAAVSLGLDPEQIFASGLQGALCGQATKDRLRAIGETFDWGSVRTLEGQIR